MIDLTQLPAPAVLAQLDFESIYAGKLARFQLLYPDFTAALESDPVVKLLELSAYDELMHHARINDASRACMLAYATGSDLDHLAALLGVSRLLLDAGDANASPPRPPEYEADDRLRLRTQMALEGQAAAGPVGAYRFHALSASADVADVGIDSPVPGTVRVAVLPNAGSASAALLTTVHDALNADDVRPLCDLVQVLAATLTPYSVVATLATDSGPDPAIALAAAQSALQAMATSHRRIGRRVPLSAIYAALHQPGIAQVTLASPVADVVCSSLQAPEMTAFTLTLA